MTVVESDVPRHSALGKDLIERADFRDAYRAPLSRSDLDVVDIFFGIFGQRPGWMNLMLVARNKVAGLTGLEVPTTLEIMNMEKRDRYFVGEKIGPWPIIFLGSDELVAGRDNKHMDFKRRWRTAGGWVWFYRFILLPIQVDAYFKYRGCRSRAALTNSF